MLSHGGKGNAANIFKKKKKCLQLVTNYVTSTQFFNLSWIKVHLRSFLFFYSELYGSMLTNKDA